MVHFVVQGDGVCGPFIDLEITAKYNQKIAKKAKTYRALSGIIDMGILLGNCETL